MSRRPSLPGLFLALLALAVQLAVGANVPVTAVPARMQVAALGIICHSDHGTNSPAPHHRAPDCQFCPLCGALTTPAPTLGSGPFVPTPVSVRTTQAAPLPPARAPPATYPFAAPPRGPPSLV